jgi:hypothetical protein
MEFILMRLSFPDGDPESEGYNSCRKVHRQEPFLYRPSSLKSRPSRLPVLL